MTPHRASYRKPVIHIPSERAPLLLSLGIAAWLGLILLGHGFWLLLTVVGAA